MVLRLPLPVAHRDRAGHALSDLRRMPLAVLQHLGVARPNAGGLPQGVPPLRIGHLQHPLPSRPAITLEKAGRTLLRPMPVFWRRPVNDVRNNPTQQEARHHSNGRCDTQPAQLLKQPQDGLHDVVDREDGAIQVNPRGAEVLSFNLTGPGRGMIDLAGNGRRRQLQRGTAGQHLERGGCVFLAGMDTGQVLGVIAAVQFLLPGRKAFDGGNENGKLVGHRLERHLGTIEVGLGTCAVGRIVDHSPIPRSRPRSSEWVSCWAIDLDLAASLMS